jgi:predicted nucleic-acid-binding protein
MIGLDTNVLVRHVTHDDAAQTESVERFLATLTRSDPGFVSLATILELVWTLQRTYQFDLESVARYVFGLLASDEIVVQAPDVVRRGLAHALDAPGGFADAVVGLLAIDAGCDYTVTFDKRAARLPGMKLLEGGAG